MSPAITAGAVARTWPPSATTPIVCRKLTTGLSSERIVSQARVRIRYVVKNGATTANRSRLRYFPALKAIAYATG